MRSQAVAAVHAYVDCLEFASDREIFSSIASQFAGVPPRERWRMHGADDVLQASTRFAGRR
jgi:hypothetical protein